MHTNDTVRLGERSGAKAGAAPLALAAVLALALVGCSNGSSSSTGGGGTGAPVAQTTYAGTTTVNGQPSTLAVTVVPTGAPSPTLGVLTGVVANATGLLVIGDGDRVDLVGSYDESMQEVTLSGTGFDFTGTATAGGVSGQLTPQGQAPIAVSLGVTASSAPIEAVLGTWAYSSSGTFDCPGTMYDEQEDCTGYFRVRLNGSGTVVVDVYDTCDGEPYECAVADIDLDNGMWNGDVYTQILNEQEVDGGCTRTDTGTLTFTVGMDQLTFAIDQVAIFTGGGCEATGSCDEDVSGSATRCTDCWPPGCGS